MADNHRVVRATTLGLRGAAILLGALFFIWLPIEDTGTVSVQFLAGGTAAWFALRHLLKAETVDARHGLLVGGIAGLCAAPFAVALMVFKGGLHNHGFPDFSFTQFSAVLGGLPWWLLGGLAFGWIAGQSRDANGEGNQ